MSVVEVEAETVIVAVTTGIVKAIAIEAETIAENARLGMISRGTAADPSHHSQKTKEGLDDVQAHQLHANGELFSFVRTFVHALISFVSVGYRLAVPFFVACYKNYAFGDGRLWFSPYLLWPPPLHHSIKSFAASCECSVHCP